MLYLIRFSSLCALLCMAGCQVQGFQRAESATVRLGDLIATFEDARAQALNSSDGLTGLRSGTDLDLTSGYEPFKDAVDAYEDAIDDGHRQLAAAERQMIRYWEAWEASLQNYTQPELRQISAERLRENQVEWRTLKAQLETSLASAGVHHAQMHDISSFLGMDLTQRGLDGAADVANRAILDTHPTRVELDASIQAMAHFSANLSAVRVN